MPYRVQVRTDFTWRVGWSTDGNAPYDQLENGTAASLADAQAQAQAVVVADRVKRTADRSPLLYDQSFVNQLTNLLLLRPEGSSFVDVMSGTATFSGSIVEGLSHAPALSGTGTFSGTNPDSWATSAALSGTGTFSGSRVEAWVHAPALSGIGVFSGTNVESWSTSKSFSGTAVFSGSLSESSGSVVAPLQIVGRKSIDEQTDAVYAHGRRK